VFQRKEGKMEVELLWTSVQQSRKEREEEEVVFELEEVSWRPIQA